MARTTSQPQSKQKNTKTAAMAAGTKAATQTGAIEMLKQDHRKVEALFEQFEQSTDDEQKERLVDQICAELIIHALLEEELFYPACRRAGVEEDKLDESQVEHDGAKMLINDLLEAHGDDDYFDAKVSVLKDMIEHHVEEEEKAGEGVFAQAQEHQIDNAGLAQQLTRRKQELQQRGVGRRPARPVAIGMRGGMGGGMAARRFGGEGERGLEERRRYEEDEARYGNRWDEGRYGGSREQQNYGRRRYEEDDRRFRSPQDDGDEDARYGRDQGGWFGDPRGHSEASRRGWDERRSYDDDRRYRGRGGDHGGWYGDSRGHAEASRRGWQHRR